MHIYAHIHYVINKMAATKCKRPVNFKFEMPVTKVNKRPTGLNGHLSIRDFTLTSCQKGSYLYINSPIIK